MARTLPHSKLNRAKLDADQAYNRAVNRGADKDHLEVGDLPPENVDTKHSPRFTKDTAGQG